MSFSGNKRDSVTPTNMLCLSINSIFINSFYMFEQMAVPSTSVTTNDINHCKYPGDEQKDES